MATATPTISITDLAFNTDLVSATVGTNAEVPVTAVPFGGTTSITFSSSDSDVFTTAAKSGEPRTAVVTPVGAGKAVLTATAGSVVANVAVEIKSA